jgi:hypothetical protein
VKQFNSSYIEEFCIFRKPNEDPIFIRGTPDEPGYFFVHEVQNSQIIKDHRKIRWNEFNGLLGKIFFEKKNKEKKHNEK